MRTTTLLLAYGRAWDSVRAMDPPADLRRWRRRLDLTGKLNDRIILRARALPSCARCSTLLESARAFAPVYSSVYS